MRCRRLQWKLGGTMKRKRKQQKIVPFCREGISFCRVLCGHILPPERSTNPKRFCQHLSFKTDFATKKAELSNHRNANMGCGQAVFTSCRRDTDGRRVLNAEKKRRSLYSAFHACTRTRLTSTFPHQRYQAVPSYGPISVTLVCTAGHVGPKQQNSNLFSSFSSQRASRLTSPALRNHDAAQSEGFFSEYADYSDGKFLFASVFYSPPTDNLQKEIAKEWFILSLVFWGRHLCNLILFIYFFLDEAARLRKSRLRISNGLNEGRGNHQRRRQRELELG